MRNHLPDKENSKAMSFEEFSEYTLKLEKRVPELMVSGTKSKVSNKGEDQNFYSEPI